ncbi:RagB/SusD family nutrient uptake outer membrane protein [Pseudoxanthomonas sp. SGD-10]|nr:RagB/SusD family nutrient uptake outer membrane protein [Pseudoxanthomonas sp. SGD-10]
MRKIHIYLYISLSLFVVVSCKEATDLLDATEVTDITPERTFSDSTLTMQFLNGAYADMAFNWEYKKYGATRTGTTDISDDGISTTENGALHSVVNGTLSPAIRSAYRDTWVTAFTNIRRINVFLANVEIGRTPMPANIVTRVRAEARFLRAWYYANMLRYFGGLPILGDLVMDNNYVFEDRRSSFAETVEYIVNELDLAAGDLPLNYNERANDFGRITKGAALALKARVLLYAASPLFNGGNIGQELGGTPEQIAVAGYENYDENRWRLAQQAAFEVIRLNEYSLYVDEEADINPPGYSFSRVFLKRKNSEYILQYNLPQNRELEADFFAPSRNSSLRAMPTHNLAEEFGMINGKRRDEAGSGYDPQNPFANRDPRFNYTIAYNGTLWHYGPVNAKIPVYTYVGAPQDGFDKKANHTGYFWRKMQEENTMWNGGPNTERCLPMIRYAETLITYAEASNEVGETDKAYDMIKLLRERAGIEPGSDGLYGLKPNMTREQMREAIQHERRVEFAYEEQRFWDVRRWKIAEGLYNGLQLTAMKVTQQFPGTNNLTDFNYEIVPIVHLNSKLVFLKRNYLFPLEQIERDKNRNLVQNPGY